MLDQTFIYPTPNGDVTIHGFLAFLLQQGEDWDFRCLEADARDYHAQQYARIHPTIALQQELQWWLDFVQELVNLIIVLYEKCFSAIWPSTKSFLRSANYFSPPTASSNVMQTNLQFSAIIYPMAAVTKRNYTDDYLSLVDSTLSDNLEKFQIMSYASVMYYSESLWLIDY